MTGDFVSAKREKVVKTNTWKNVKMYENAGD
jgi:hypothetical protein